MRIAVWLFCQGHHRKLVWDRPLGYADLTHPRILRMRSNFHLHRTEVTGFPLRCTVLVWPCLSIGSCPPNWQILWGYLGKKKSCLNKPVVSILPNESLETPRINKEIKKNPTAVSASVPFTQACTSYKHIIFSFCIASHSSKRLPQPLQSRPMSLLTEIMLVSWF